MKKDSFVSRINTPPKGLQNLLGNINQGINPSNLSQEVYGVTDLYPHWTANKLDVAFATAEVAGVTGQGVGIAIPEGEIWQPLALSMEYELVGTNADDTGISVGIQKLGTGYYVALFRSDQAVNAVGAAGEFQIACGPLTERFYLDGRWQFWAQVDGAAQSNVRTMTIQVLYAKLSD